MKLDPPFLLYLAGVFGCYSSSIGVYVLVSSFNVDEGLGTWSLALGYAASLVAASLTPFVGYIVGCKKLLVISEVGYLLFIVGNSYTSYFTVLPAGLLMGISEAWAWTAMPIITTYFADKRANGDSSNKEKHNRYYTGYYYAVVHGSAVIGNGLSFVILHIDRSLSNVYNETQVLTIDYGFCGANDCQIANVTETYMQQYEPVFPVTRYILIAVYSCLMIGAILLHAFFLPSDINWETQAEKPAVESGDVEAHRDGEDIRDAEQRLCHHNDTAEVPQHELLNPANEPSVKLKKVSLTAVLKSSCTSTLKIAFTPKHVLVALMPIYNGMTIGYCLGELTRAYASCMLGVDKVGVCMMVYAFADCIFSLFAGKTSGKYGRNFPYVFAFAVDLSLYLFCLHWQTNADNLWLVYLIFFLYGSSDGIWQTLNTALYGEYFVTEQKVAYNLWNVVTNVGFLIQFSISTSLCVYAKIYLQMATLCAAVLLYGISQLVYYPPKLCRRKKSHQ